MNCSSDDDNDDKSSSSASKTVANNSNNTTAAANANNAERDDDELSIPRAALNKMIKELTPNIRVANESRELILNCCTEFIHLVSTEANELCNKQQKKTISHEHVFEALDNLGFSCYKEEATAVLEEAKKVATSKRQKKSRLENSGIPEEELFQLQQELFAKARMQLAQTEQKEWQEMQIKLQQQQLLQQQQEEVDDDNNYNL